MGNNQAHPDWGAANTTLHRLAPPDYGDGTYTLAGGDRPSPRLISNRIFAQDRSLLNDRALSDLVWQWGQFLDHDIDLTVSAIPAESTPIAVPAGDPQFDPTGTGTQVIPFHRSAYASATGLPDQPRQQVNAITAFIDGSNVYGSDPERARALRTFEGGTLKTSFGDLLPFNTDGLPNANGGPFAEDRLFLAGDVRANEQVGLTTLHTLFVREHNRLAGEIAAAHPDWSDEPIYQRARRIVGAEIQAITYREFLPALLGPYAPSWHGRYDPTIDPSILNEFSTAFFRVGHTMLSPQLQRLQDNGTPAPGGPIPLQEAFFNPTLLATPGDLDVILKGLATQRMQEVDTRVVDGVRNFLFGPPGAGGFDLVSLNIQRGRDHGLPDYNTLRVAFGLPRVRSFAQITSDRTLQDTLRSLYGSVDDIDPWVGALAEDHLRGASVGPLIAAALNEQFRCLRDGDRFWFENDPAFTPRERRALARTTLSAIIRRNTGITRLQGNVFSIPGGRDRSHAVHRTQPGGHSPVPVAGHASAILLPLVGESGADELQDFGRQALSLSIVIRRRIRALPRPIGMVSAQRG